MIEDYVNILKQLNFIQLESKKGTYNGWGLLDYNNNFHWICDLADYITLTDYNINVIIYKQIITQYNDKYKIEDDNIHGQIKIIHLNNIKKFKYELTQILILFKKLFILNRKKLINNDFK